MDLFACPRHAGDLRITPATCARMYRRAIHAERFDPITLCLGCPIGAAHAGETIPRVEDIPQPPKNLCCRCGATDRRLVRGQICVSCYNREREALRGRVLRRAVTLMPVAIAAPDQVVECLAGSKLEAALWSLRKAPGAMVGRLGPTAALATSMAPEAP